MFAYIQDNIIKFYDEQNNRLSETVIDLSSISTHKAVQIYGYSPGIAVVMSNFDVLLITIFRDTNNMKIKKVENGMYNKPLYILCNPRPNSSLFRIFYEKTSIYVKIYVEDNIDDCTSEKRYNFVNDARNSVVNYVVPRSEESLIVNMNIDGQERFFLIHLFDKEPTEKHISPNLTDSSLYRTELSNDDVLTTINGVFSNVIKFSQYYSSVIYLTIDNELVIMGDSGQIIKKIENIVNFHLLGHKVYFVSSDKCLKSISFRTLHNVRIIGECGIIILPTTSSYDTRISKLPDLKSARKLG